MQIIEESAEIIKNGGVVAFPTETVYGLAASAFDKNAVARIYEIKGRPKNNPMQIMVPSLEDAMQIGEFNASAKILAEKFWPGALTIVVKKKPESKIVEEVSAGNQGTIGIRIPNHELAMKLLLAAGTPLATTSANLSGENATTNSDEVEKIFSGKVDMIIKGAPSKIGVASTVVDMSGAEIKILREGSISAKDILAAIS